MSNDKERLDILARLKSGVDVRNIRLRSWRTAGVIALVGGMAWAFLKNKQTKGLSPAGLKAQGFDDAEVTRIMAVQPLVQAHAPRYGLSTDLVNGVIWVESRFHKSAKSGAGASGLMQLMPGTQDHWENVCAVGPGSATDPDHNIELGSCGLRRLIDRYDGNLRLALGAYNWGSGHVDGSGGELPPNVENYVTKVTEARDRFARARA